MDYIKTRQNNTMAYTTVQRDVTCEPDIRY